MIRCTRPDSTAAYMPPAVVDRRAIIARIFASICVGQRLDVVRAAERIDHVGQVRLLAQDVLRRDGDARRLSVGTGEHLVVGVGVQRLQAAEDAGHRLHRRRARCC